MKVMLLRDERTAAHLITIKATGAGHPEDWHRTQPERDRAMTTTASDIVSERLEPHAMRLSTRKRQKLALARTLDETVYLVRSGLYLARAVVTAESRQVLGTFYPGDLVRAMSLPPLDGAEIATASEHGEVWRLRWPAVEGATARDPDLAHLVLERFAAQAARLSLHNAIVANLTGDARVAALMLELALRTGRRTPSGIVFEMPLSRLDIAEHLSLNADTVSRIVSRMRAANVVVPANREHLVCPSLDALAGLCPLYEAIRRAHAPRAQAAVVA